jgi:hypothetical protein
MVDAQTVSMVFGGLSVGVAAIYYILTLRTNQRNIKQTLDTRQVQLFMNIYQKFEEPDFQSTFWDLMSYQWKDFDDYLAKYGQEANASAWIKFQAIGTFFEGIGVLVKRGFIDATLVDDMMSSFIILWWQKFEPVTIGIRNMYNNPAAGEYGEELYRIVYGIWRQQHAEAVMPKQPQ